MRVASLLFSSVSKETKHQEEEDEEEDDDDGEGGEEEVEEEVVELKTEKKEIDELPASREKQQDEPLRQPAITSSIAVSYANLLCKCLIIYARLHLPSIDPN